MSEIKETTTLIKKIGERFNMRCPLHPGDENGIYSFTKMNKSTGKLELVHQGRDLDMTITDLSDAGIYCCKPHCANNTKSCCVNIQGIYNIIMQTGFGKSSLISSKIEYKYTTPFANPVIYYV